MSFRSPTSAVAPDATNTTSYTPSNTGTLPKEETTLHNLHVSWVLIAAFTLSVSHTIYASLVGLESPGFTLTSPTTYAFYAVGFGAAALARRPGRMAQSVLLGYLTIVLLIGVFYYPTTFTVAQQTTFGWFENDVYIGLLVVATYLTVAGRFGVRLTRDSRLSKS